MTIKEKLIKAIEESEITNKELEEILEEDEFGITIHFHRNNEDNFELCF